MATTQPGPATARSGAASRTAGDPKAPLLATLDMEDADAGLDAAGWTALAVGFGLAALTQVVPFLEMLVGYFVVLVHEMGHAIAGWLFGYPSLPAFDFTYGGGVTSHAGAQSQLIVWLVLGTLAFLGWVFRGNRLTVSAVAVVTVIYAALAFTPAHHAFIVAFGHGAELVFAFVFLQRAFTGNACQLPAERPLYAWLGFHVVLHDVFFAWGLATSALSRQQYADAKGGGHWMDFSRLANEHMGVSLETIAVGFLALCLLTPVLAFAWSWVGPQRAELRLKLGEI